MGLRFRKSIKIAPGVKLNLNKKSSSVTFGVKGAHVTFNSKGKATTSVGAPGTGIYYTETTDIGGKKIRNGRSKTSADGSKKKGWCLKPFLIIIGIIIVIGIVGSMLDGGSDDASPAQNEEILLQDNVKETSEQNSESKNASPGNSDEQITSDKTQDGADPSGIVDIASLETTQMYASSTLNIRSENNADSDILGKLSTNDSVNVVSVDGDWATIVYNGALAYVASDYLSSSKIETQNKTNVEMVWISSTGEKYHRNSNCSGMSNPSQVSIDEAKSMGLTPCKKCY